jgi:hypothetical protein
MSPISLRLDPAAAERNQRRSWQRAIAARALSAIQKDSAAKIIEKAWPDDRQALHIVRAASTDLAAAFRSLAPGSALFELLGLGTGYDLTGITTLKLPHVSGLPPVPIFVGTPDLLIVEPGIAPNLQRTFANTTLGPVRKILVMAAVSGELQLATPETASAVIGRVLADATAKSIDTVGFDANPADLTRPPGLLNGVTPLTAAAVAAGVDAMAEDIGNLLAAIAAANIDASDAVFVGSAREIGILKAKLGPKFSNPLLVTLGLPAKTLAAFAPAALAWADHGEVEIETRFENTPGPVVAAPGLLSISVRANTAWAVMPGGAQVVTNVNW